MSLAAGERIGRYEILAPIGAGSMGEVYRARDSQLDRSVAIKIQLTHLRPDDEPLQWSTSESHLYVLRTGAWPPAVDLVNMTTGEREPWKTIQPADPAGVDVIHRILITPDGKSYCHDYVRFLSELFVVEGLK